MVTRSMMAEAVRFKLGMEFWRQPDKIKIMRPTYKHTQTGEMILGAMAVCSLIVIVVYLFNRNHPVTLAILFPLLACAALFCSLTIQINDQWLTWCFGPGLISKRVALKEIASAEPIRNSWICGWGIHYTKGGVLYNVSGMDGVQITMKNGKRFRLGTDEPEALTAAIRSQIS